MARWDASQSSLPPELQREVGDLRSEWADTLRFAARGGRDRDEELRRLKRRLGTMLAREARKSPEQRGVRMIALALELNAAFPELRSFEERERRRWERLAASRALYPRTGRSA